MNEALALAATWFAVALLIGVVVLAFAAVTARSLLVMCASLAGVSALAAATGLLLGAGDGALAVAVLGVALAPTILFGAILLSGRTLRPRRGAPWMSALVVAALSCAAAFAGLDLQPMARVSAAASEPVSLWLCAIVFVAVVGFAGLLGYGERGVLQKREPRL